MKKFSLSSFLLKLIFVIVVIFGFIYVFSLAFPRAYNVLEAKALGIEEDTITAVVQPPLLSKDSMKVVKPAPKEFKVAVKLRHEGNCYYVPTKINGIPMKMLLDTGASHLTISVVEYEFLRKQGLLKDNSIQVGSASIASGDEIKCYNIKIDEITIGNIPIKNVDCTVMEQQDAPVLLGMNVLNQLGNFSIDYKRSLLIIK